MTVLSTGIEQMSQIWDIVHDGIVPGLFEEYKTNTFLWGKLKAVHCDGRETKIDHELGINRNGGFVAERGTMPIAKGRLFKRSTLDLKSFYVKMEFTGQELHMTKGKEARLDVIAHGTKTTYKAAQQLMDSVLWGNGSGRVVQIAGAPTYAGDPGWTYMTIDTGTLFHLRMYQDVHFGTDGDLYEIVKIDHVNNVLYVAGNASAVATNDVWVYRALANASTNTTEPIGLESHLDDSNPPSGEYQGLDRDLAGYDWLNCTVDDLSGAAFSELLIEQFIDKIMAAGGEEVPNLFIIPPPIKNSYKLLLRANNQGIETIPSKLGFGSAIKYVYGGKELEWQVTNHCPAQTLLAVNTNNIKRYVNRELEWRKDYNNQQLRASNTQDLFSGELVSYFTTGCTYNANQGKMENIKENSIT